MTTQLLNLQSECGKITTIRCCNSGSFSEDPSISEPYECKSDSFHLGPFQLKPFLFERSEFLIPTWVTPQYRATSKKKICACVRLILVLVGKKICACVRLILVLVGGRQTAKTNKITRTFRPWTHTSDDSYIYQLSLVVATATVSFLLIFSP